MLTRFFVMVFLCLSVSSAWAAESMVPSIEGDWWQVAGNPDLGDLTSEKQEPVDFGVWQAADGTWQLWSCIRKTNEPGNTRLFYRWEGEKLTDADWKPCGISMRASSQFGEHPGGLQAPYTVNVDGRYYMFYGDWERICVATSTDGKVFERLVRDGRGPQLFGEGRENKTRDPMLLRVNGVWHCYFCAYTGAGGIFVRTTTDLLDWSSSRSTKVCSGGAPGSVWWNAECPHVVRRHGYFYLFRTSNYKTRPKTTVYRSKDPLNFGIDDDSKIVTILPVAAAEIIRHAGVDYIASLRPELDGIRVARLRWNAKED